MGALLTFRLMSEWWGLDLLRAHEVLRCDEVTFVPALPPWIRGIVAVRGVVVPVVDLSMKLRGMPAKLSTQSCIVLLDASLGGPPVTIGVLVEEIGGIEAPEALEPPPAFGVPVRLELLLGVARCTERSTLILVLDLDRVLDASELLAAERAATIPPSTEPDVTMTGERS